MNQLPVHSPLGASSAERWMNCPGSIALLKLLKIEEDSDEEDYQREGTAAHSAAAHCLISGLEAWEVIGTAHPNGVVVDATMARNIQTYLDTIGPIGDGHYVEYRISLPTHKWFYGTADHGETWLDSQQGGDPEWWLGVDDFKYGAGIVVEAEDNPQLMYYAYGFLETRPEIDWVRLRIHQPRAPYGPKLKEWIVSADHIREWARTKLFPAMAQTEIDDTLDPGEHCRFCPAKLICPALVGLFRAAALANAKDLVNQSDAALALTYRQKEGVKFYLKALDQEVFKRLMGGHDFGEKGPKLGHKKGNRVWRPGAEERFKSLYGDEAYEPTELKSPAQMELLPRAADIVKELSFMPETGLTVVAWDKPGHKVVPKTANERYKNFIDTPADPN